MHISVRITWRAPGIIKNGVVVQDLYVRVRRCRYTYVMFGLMLTLHYDFGHFLKRFLCFTLW